MPGGCTEAAAIRPATPEDIPALSELARRTWSETFGHSVSADDAESYLEATRSPYRIDEALREEVILVADANGVLLGYVQFGPVTIPEIETGPADGGLHRLYVASEAQGWGLGRRLTEAALAHPALADARRIFLSVWERNEKAIHLYESLGFRTIGTTRFTIGDALAEDLVMVFVRAGLVSP
jgi:ribosomal protein S18 acetylase RimI-like enzyme